MRSFDKKKLIRIGVILLCALVLGTAAELLFVRASNPHEESYYPKTQLTNDDFETWEFESDGVGRYYALAYNSYFLAENLGGIPSQNLSVSLFRDAGDATETVVYYTGTVEGAYGEYIAPLVEQRGGLYTASIPADSLESIRIYPTETVRSTVTFSGACVNYVYESESFSIARVILWVYILLALYMAYRIIAFRFFKKSEKPNAWLCVYLYITALALLAGFEGTRIFTALRELQFEVLLGLFVCVSALYGCLYAICVKLKTPAAKLGVCVLLAGAIMSVSNAPLQTPDEYWHYLRAYSISCGRLDFQYDEQFPNDVKWLCDRFPGVFEKSVHQSGEDTVLGRLSSYNSRSGMPYTGKQTVTTPIQLVLPYIPAALGMQLVRLLGGGALICMYAGRIANALVLAVCAWYALSRAKRFRPAIILTALLPMTLFMGASLSYDSMFLSALLVFFGIVLSDEFKTSELVLLCVSFALMVMIKPIYAPLIFAVFAIPKENFRLKRGRRFAVFAAAVLAGGLLYVGSLLYAQAFAHGIPRVEAPVGADVASQISYILHNPVRYALTALVDGYYNSFYLGTFGDFGWLDAVCRMTSLLTPALILFTAFFCTDDVLMSTKRRQWLWALITVGIYAVVVTGFYCTWSTLGSTSILGVQSRYFIPIILPLCILLSHGLHALFSNDRTMLCRRERRDNVCIYVCLSAAMIACGELVMINYLT